MVRCRYSQYIVLAGRKDMKIESPSSQQKADALREEILDYAATGASETDLVMRMMSKGVKKEDAEAILPSILQSVRGDRRRVNLVGHFVGGALTIGGFGFGMTALAKGVIWGPPLMIGGLGLAIWTGYIRNPFRDESV